MRGTLAGIGIPLAVSYVVDVAVPGVAATPVLAMGDETDLRKIAYFGRVRGLLKSFSK